MAQRATAGRVLAGDDAQPTWALAQDDRGVPARNEATARALSGEGKRWPTRGETAATRPESRSRGRALQGFA